MSRLCAHCQEVIGDEEVHYRVRIEIIGDQDVVPFSTTSDLAAQVAALSRDEPDFEGWTEQVHQLLEGRLCADCRRQFLRMTAPFFSLGGGHA